MSVGPSQFTCCCFVVVYCGMCDVSGLECSNGRSVAVFNTCLNDLIPHIMALQKSLAAQWYDIISTSMKAGEVNPDMESVTEFGDNTDKITEDCSLEVM